VAGHYSGIFPVFRVSELRELFTATGWTLAADTKSFAAVSGD